MLAHRNRMKDDQMNRRSAALPLLLLAGLSGVADAQPRPGESAIVFESDAGDIVDAYEGSLSVPENRNVANSRQITLKYVRFPSTGDTPGTPIVYLSGGPGGSGIQTAKYQRFPLFMAMREFGDVIALDQRGTGASNDLPNCTSSQHISATEPTTDVEFFAFERAAFAECLDYWKSEGVDVYGYTTSESVADLAALRRHLGSEQIDLWGISYGSHLSLAALQQIDDQIGRVVITAIEGLDQTVKQPARGDAYFDRLQSAIDKVPTAKEKYPDVKALIARVLTRLDQTPLLLEFPTQDGEAAPYLLQKRDLQKITSALIADPARAVWILEIFRALDGGDTAPVIALLQRAVDPTDTAISFRPMTVLMDVASGSSPERRAMITQQAETALMGPHMNFSMHLETVDASLDLGETFRSAPVSDVPTLVISGTLDGRTYPESGQEATAGLSNRQTVIVENGGHNVFMQSPEVTTVIQDFMRGETVDGREIYIELPEF